MIWTMDHTRGSVLAAVFFHALVNTSGEILELTTGAQIIRLLLWTTAAVAVALPRRSHDVLQPAPGGRRILEEEP
jgi:hypothetical protein